METDVLIAGAGPVGLMLALELARYGLHVRLIDPDDAPTEQSRALVVWPRTLEHLARHPGLDERFLSNGLRVTEAHFFHGGKPLASTKLDTVDTPYPFALMVPQSETERLLTERLAELGVQVERRTSFTSFRENGSSVTSTLQHADGAAEELTTRWLVGADGAHSAVRHALGVGFTGEQLPSDWVLADVHLDGDVLPDAVELHLHPEGVLAIFPLPPNRFRVIAAYLHGEHEPTLEEMQRILDQRRGPGVRAHDPVWLSQFHISERIVENFRRGNVFLAGDAAHIHSPAGGQGMNTGMQDAVNLAWKIALISGGHLSKAGEETLLASYNEERHPVAQDVLTGAGLLTRAAMVDNSLLSHVRNAAIRTAFGLDLTRHSFAEAATELAVSYPHSRLNGRDDKLKGGPRVGQRAPVHAGDAPVSTGPAPLFTLFATKGPDSSQLIDCYPQFFAPEPRPPFVEGGIWIVRPDGYVAFAGDSDSWAAADAYLAKLVYHQG
ncbi:MAG: FAD-dependent monooxygenase [Acidobacteriaceae bacterium]|nr:FAD-dependent monooxygenase [Acidobacteriaceae bacterium]